jgi:hypothetical protein
MSDDDALACARCGATYAPDERFCVVCGMPLVHAAGREQEPISEAQERARKIRPQYSRGELVKVGLGQNQAEGELIQGILLEEGIPSILRRTRGFDVPDFLAAGPRDVMVPESGVEAARRLLDDAQIRAGGEPGGPAAEYRRPAALRVLAGVIAMTLFFGALAGVLYWLTG